MLSKSFPPIHTKKKYISLEEVQQNHTFKWDIPDEYFLYLEI